jgi:superfamily II DNA or RNA helicase
LVRKPLAEPLGPEFPKVDNFPEDPRYDYQMQTVVKLLDKGRMIAQIATGGGKSRISRLAYRRIGRNTMFLTTRGILMHQMKDAFEEMGERVGVIGDGEFSPINGFNVAMVQSIAAMLKDPARSERIKKILSYFEFIILEEAHEISGNGYYEILNLCTNAQYRLALTATPFMKTNGEANMRLHAAVGGLGIRVTEKTLIDRGILAKPYFKFAVCEKPRLLYKTTAWQSAYRIGIAENESRNKIIVFEVARVAKHKLTSMVLVQHKSHGDKLNEMFKKVGIRSEFIFGEHSKAERSTAIEKLKSGQLDVLIGSTILDVGVDVPAVFMVVLAGGGKAEEALRQRIGRGLREKKDKRVANISFILDFIDEHNNHLRKHAAARRQIIESTDGFKQGILKHDEDFDYSLIWK